jgi:hypothetical protein
MSSRSPSIVAVAELPLLLSSGRDSALYFTIRGKENARVTGLCVEYSARVPFRWPKEAPESKDAMEKRSFLQFVAAMMLGHLLAIFRISWTID